VLFYVHAVTFVRFCCALPISEMRNVDSNGNWEILQRSKQTGCSMSRLKIRVVIGMIVLRRFPRAGGRVRRIMMGARIMMSWIRGRGVPMIMPSLAAVNVRVGAVTAAGIISRLGWRQRLRRQRRRPPAVVMAAVLCVSRLQTCDENVSTRGGGEGKRSG